MTLVKIKKNKKSRSSSNRDFMSLFQVNVNYLIVRHVSYRKQSTNLNKLEIILAAVALFVIKLVHVHILLLYFFRSIIERV